MVRSLHITTSDFLDDDIQKMMNRENKSNKSEYVSDIIRLGLQERKIRLEEEGK